MLHKQPQTTTNHNKPPQTATNFHKPPQTKIVVVYSRFSSARPSVTQRAVRVALAGLLRRAAAGRGRGGGRDLAS